MRSYRNAILRWGSKGLRLALLVAVVGTIVYVVRFSPISVVEHKIQSGDIKAEVMGTGTLEARVKATISPKISGRISEILVDQGDRVRKGDLLVGLDDEELAQQVEIALANLAASKASAERLVNERLRIVAVINQAKREHERHEKLIKDKAISESEFDLSAKALAVAEADLATADAAIVEGQQQVLAAEKTLAYHRARQADTEIKAPFDGLIIERKRDPGDVVVPGSPVLNLVSLEQLWISAWIDETQMAQIDLGQSARVVFRSEPDRDYPGEVSRLGKEADRETREFIVDIQVLELPRNWAVGQRAEVYIETGSKTDVPLLDTEAVRWHDKSPGVFVDDEGYATWRPLRLGLRNHEKVEVVEGLLPGDVAIVPTNPKKELTEGKRIVVQ